MPKDALSVLCAPLTRDLLAIAKFLFIVVWQLDVPQNVFFYFPTVVWALAIGGFLIAFDTFVLL